MKILRSGIEAPTRGRALVFTGAVHFDWRFEPPAPGRAWVAHLSFDAGARTAWHTHPLGQTLIVTSGVGWTQCEGGPKTEIRVGDIVWCPPRHRHWHGATPTSAMSHLAVTEALDGRTVEWMEYVSDADYLSGVAIVE